MKLIFTLASLLYFSFVSHAQVSIDWIKQSSTDQSGGAVIADSLNNTYAVGIRNNFTYLTKRDKAGNVIWQKSASSSYFEGVTNVFIDPAGNPTVTGFQYYNTINGIVAVGLIVRKFTPAGDSVYRKIVSGLFTFLDGGDIEHPGNNQTKISSVMDVAGNVYFGTAGEAGNGKGFQFIKVTRNGAASIIKAQNFKQDTTGNPFFLARNISVKNNRVGITGTTDRTLSNTCTWIIDTTGTTVWTNITPKVAGTDLLFDDAMNVFVLAQASNLAKANKYTGGDIALIKFNKSGKRQFLKAYDFGNDEIVMKFTYAPDKNFIIMARAGGTSTLGYLDWFTVKLSYAGQVLWSSRYNASNYDEIPKQMVLDGAGNVYITGSGGPDTGDFLYGLYGVTIKYSPSGLQRWKSLIHLYNFLPVSITLGKDTSVFILSSPNATVAHLLQTSKSSTCATPSALKATSVTKNNAVISWKKVPDAFLYYVQYKTSTATSWTQDTTGSNSFALTGLQQGTQYSFKVQAICAVGPSDFSGAVNFTTLGIGYCISKGPDNNCQWIDGVQLGSINSYPSGPNMGYKDFTNQSTSLTQGSTYTITTNKYNLCGSQESWRIWIDYNHDGDFNDANEMVVQYSNNYNYDYHDFTVPASALTGITRMRVSMKAGSAYSSPCEMLPDGEVEDYTVNIIAPAFKNAFAADGQMNIDKLIVYPNPAKSFIEISIGKRNESINVLVYNSSGKLMLSREVKGSTRRLSISMLPPGLYFVTASNASGIRTAKFIKE